MSQSRREFITVSIAALAAGAWAPRGRAAIQQPQQAPLTPVFTPIRRNVGFFTGRGGTIGYLINPGGVAVVDSQFPDAAAACVLGLKERSGGRPVDVLVNTHHHGDHTAGNIAFKDVAKQVVAHERAAEHMRQPPGRPAPAGEQLYPTATFAESWEMHVGDESIRARYYGRAHTGGDAVVTFTRANVAHMGDLMFNRRHAVIDRPAGAWIRNWATILDRAAADHAADTVYIFGHAGANHPVTGGRADLALMRDYLQALLAYVEAGMKAGRTRDEILASTDVLRGFDDHGPLNRTVLTNAYDELAGS